MPRPFVVLAGYALALLATSGCEDDATGVASGVLTARWGGSLCAEDGVSRVSLSLAGEPLTDAVERRVTCGDQEVRFDDIPEGVYDLTVEFLAPGDGGVLPVADGTGAPVDSLVFEVHVVAGSERTVFVGADVLTAVADGGVDPDAPVPPPPPPPPTDVDADGHIDDFDNCPDLFNPDQYDTDQDSSGNACDCAPFDAALSETELDDELDTDLTQFTAVDGLWGFFAGVYRQSDPDGLSRSWRPTEDLAAASIETLVDLGAAGTGAVGGVGFAGVVLRATGFSAGPTGQAYVCGSDGDVLQIGILDAGAGTFTALTSQVLPFSMTTSAPLLASAIGDTLLCRLTNPADSTDWIEITAVDSSLDSGATGLVTNGWAADYAFARICSQ